MAEQNDVTPYVTQDEHREALAQLCQELLIDVYDIRQDVRALTQTVQNVCDDMHVQMQGFRQDIREGFQGRRDDMQGMRDDIGKFSRTMQLQMWILTVLVLAMCAMVFFAE